MLLRRAYPAHRKFSWPGIAVSGQHICVISLFLYVGLDFLFVCLFTVPTQISFKSLAVVAQDRGLIL